MRINKIKPELMNFHHHDEHESCHIHEEHAHGGGHHHEHHDHDEHEHHHDEHDHHEHGEHHHDHDEHCDHDHEHHHDSCGCGHEHGHHHHDGCGCGHEHGHHDGEEEEFGKGKIIICSVFFVLALLCEHLPLTKWIPSLAEIKISWLKYDIITSLTIVFSAIAFIVSGKDIVVEAVKNLLRGEFLDERFLMSISSIGALVLGEYPEAAAIMILYQIGEKFEDFAVDKSRDAIGEIAKMRPDTANVKTGKEIKEVPVDEVKIGTVIIVKAGERIPIDGVITEGDTFVDTSALTGESVPRHVMKGDEVLSGSINKQGVIEIKTTKASHDSALARILELVENATENKTRSEQFVTRFAKIYTPIVCVAALVIAFVPPLFTKFFMPDYFMQFGFKEWVYRALEFLVVSCPCALVISIPLSFCCGITSSAKNGILIKGSTFLEALAKTKIAVFDKTGTLTKGNFVVTDIHPMNPSITKQELIAIATHAELLSTHPISASLRAIHHENCCDKVKLENVEDITSKGIKAVVNKKTVLAGNASLMEMFKVDYPECPEHKDGTIIHVACDGKYAGHIVISDEIKDDSEQAIRELKKVGVENIVMLTGDNRTAALSVAQRLGVHKVYDQMMSSDKLKKVEELLKELEISPATEKRPAKKRGTLIFTGDGINDAPVLARADAGIAMGAMGSDAAVEAGDIIIMEDKPSKITQGIKTAKKTLRVVNENLYGSLGIKGAILVLSALGISNMWIAVFGDVGVTILAVLNSLRLLRKTTNDE